MGSSSCPVIFFAARAKAALSRCPTVLWKKCSAICGLQPLRGSSNCSWLQPSAAVLSLYVCRCAPAGNKLARCRAHLQLVHLLPQLCKVPEVREIQLHSQKQLGLLSGHASSLLGRAARGQGSIQGHKATACRCCGWGCLQSGPHLPGGQSFWQGIYPVEVGIHLGSCHSRDEGVCKVLACDGALRAPAGCQPCASRQSHLRGPASTSKLPVCQLRCQAMQSTLHAASQPGAHLVGSGVVYKLQADDLVCTGSASATSLAKTAVLAQAWVPTVQGMQEARKLGQVQAALAAGPKEGLHYARLVLAPALQARSGKGCSGA